MRRDGEEVHLTPIEWGLAETLVRNRDRLVSQRQLLQTVWGPQYETETNYLRVHMANLRRKLEARPVPPAYFITEPGMGYRFHLDGALNWRRRATTADVSGPSRVPDVTRARQPATGDKGGP